MFISMTAMLYVLLALLVLHTDAQPSPLSCELELGANCREQYYDAPTDRCVECTTCRYVPANIIFALDRSTSISFPEFELAKGFLASSIRLLNVTVTELDASDSTTIGGDGIRIGLIVFGDIAERVIDFAANATADDIVQDILDIPYDLGSTNLHLAIDEAVTMFSQPEAQRAGGVVPENVFVVITDGRATSTSLLNAALATMDTSFPDMRKLAIAVLSSISTLAEQQVLLNQLQALASTPPVATTECERNASATVRAADNFDDLTGLLNWITASFCAGNTCPDGFYVSQNCSNIRDRVCTRHSDCCTVDPRSDVVRPQPCSVYARNDTTTDDDDSGAAADVNLTLTIDCTTGPLLEETTCRQEYVVSSGDLQQDVQCAPVSKFCPEPGMYISRNASTVGDIGCASCAPGTFAVSLRQFACEPQRRCPAGEYISTVATTSSDATCTTCTSGYQPVPSFVGTACTPWRSCGPGTYINVPGTATSDRTCDDCAPSTFQPSDLDTFGLRCLNMTRCGAGQFVRFSGNATTNRQCGPCPRRTFQPDDDTDATTCTRAVECTVLNAETAVPSTPTSDAVCAPCTATEYFNRMSQTCMPITTCVPELVAPTATSDRECLTNSTCGAGAYVDLDATPSGGTPTCRPCTTCSYIPSDIVVVATYDSSVSSSTGPAAVADVTRLVVEALVDATDGAGSVLREEHSRLALVQDVSSRDVVFNDFNDFQYDTSLLVSYLETSANHEILTYPGRTPVENGIPATPALVWNKTLRYIFDSRMQALSGFRGGDVPIWLIQLDVTDTDDVDPPPSAFLPIGDPSNYFPSTSLRYHRFVLQPSDNATAVNASVNAVVNEVQQLLCGDRACPAHQYQSQSCQPTMDRQCRDVTVCRSCQGSERGAAQDCVDEQETIPATATSDRLCVATFVATTPEFANSTENATALASTSDDNDPAWYAWMLIGIGALLLCCLLCVCCLAVCTRREKREDVYFHPQSHKHLQVNSKVRAARPLDTWDASNTYDLEPLQWSTREHEIKMLTKQARIDARALTPVSGFTTPVKRRSVVNHGLVVAGRAGTHASSVDDFNRKIPAPPRGVAYPDMFPAHGEILSEGTPRTQEHTSPPSPARQTKQTSPPHDTATSAPRPVTAAEPRNDLSSNHVQPGPNVQPSNSEDARSMGKSSTAEPVPPRRERPASNTSTHGATATPPVTTQLMYDEVVQMPSTYEMPVISAKSTSNLSSRTARDEKVLAAAAAATRGASNSILPEYEVPVETSYEVPVDDSHAFSAPDQYGVVLSSPPTAPAQKQGTDTAAPPTTLLWKQEPYDVVDPALPEIPAQPSARTRAPVVENQYGVVVSMALGSPDAVPESTPASTDRNGRPVPVTAPKMYAHARNANDDEDTLMI
eukprot:m.1148037 g.1148037  ORF g.1148037 m.1148037 type:complete len:1387 (+) comp24472_c0_seq3:460-4620(+)